MHWCVAHIPYYTCIVLHILHIIYALCCTHAMHSYHIVYMLRCTFSENSLLHCTYSILHMCCLAHITYYICVMLHPFQFVYALCCQSYMCMYVHLMCIHIFTFKPTFRLNDHMDRHSICFARIYFHFSSTHYRRFCSHTVLE